MHTIDPRGGKVGGIETHIRLLLSKHPADISILLVGIDEIGDVELGRVRRLAIEGREIDFLPVARIARDEIDVAARRLFRSVTLRYVVGALRHLKTIRRALGPGPASADLHRYEYAPIARLLGLPAVQMIHGEGKRDDAMDSLTKRYWALHRLGKAFALRSAARILCVNEDLLRDLARENPAAHAKAEVMTVSVDTDRFRPTKLQVEDTFRVVFAGRLDAFKDPPLMFETVRLLHEALGDGLEFHYVGATDPHRYPEFAAIEGCTIRHGRQDAAGVATILAQCHAGILTSHFEGMPCFLLEGLASGRPFGAVRLPQYDELIGPGRGRLVEREADRGATARHLAQAFLAMRDDIRAGRINPAEVSTGATPFSVAVQLGRLFDLHRTLDDAPHAGGGTLFGARITDATRPDLAHRLVDEPLPPGSGLRLVATMNLDHVVTLRRDPAFRKAYDRAWAVTIDGAPVALYARLKGLRRPRVTGADLLVDLVPLLRPGRHRPFFLVSTEATARGLVELFARGGFETGAIGWAVPPFGFERDEALSDALCRAIRAHGATHLVVGLGAPKSEIWIDRHRAELGDLYALALGSAPDFLAGTARRAPKMLRRLGLEWAWRVAQEPRRLARRYFVTSWGFLPAIVEDARGGLRARRQG